MLNKKKIMFYSNFETLKYLPLYYFSAPVFNRISNEKKNINQII